MNIAVIGSGNVSWHFACRLSENSAFSVTIYHLSPLSDHWSQVSNISFSNNHSIENNFDLIIIAVTDKAISEVISGYKFPDNAVITHTAGSVPLSVLNSFKNRGVIYPLQSLKKGLEVDDIPVLIEYSNSKAEAYIKTVAKTFGTSIENVDSDQRKKLHLAAIFASNFVNHLLAISERLAIESCIDPSLLTPLVNETIRKAYEMGAIKAQTGPADRKDYDTMTSHLKLLTDNYEREVYTLLSKGIVSYKEDG
jgi:predicted short-subunit dehydrogenase-like oxidoreductase (DUF2520 family)